MIQKSHLILIIVTLLHLHASLFSQTWEQSYDYGLDEWSEKMVYGPDGDILLFGRQVALDFSYYNTFTLKVDLDGVEQWTLTEDDEEGYQYIFAAVALPDGNLLIGQNGLNEPSSIRKITPDGDVIWMVELNESVMDHIADILILSDGQYLIVGREGGGNSPQNVLQKYDEEGNFIWSLEYGDDTLDNWAPAATNADDGGFVVVNYEGWGNPGVGYDIWIHKFNLNGEEQWSHSYGEGDTNLATDIIGTSDGGYLVSATTEGIGFGQIDMYLLKLDSEGNLEWSKTYGGPLNDFAIELLELEEGGYVIGGGTNSFGNGLNDLYLVRITEDGTVVWTQTFGNETNQNFKAILPADDGGFYLGGITENEDDNWDFYLVKAENIDSEFTNLIKGNVYWDLDQNCELEASDDILENWMLHLSGDQEQYTYADDEGYYEFYTGEGSFEIAPILLSPYWISCDLTYDVEFTEPEDTAMVDVGLLAIIDCPLMEVSITSPFLRRCFTSTYYVDYCNLGTIDPEDAYITVELDSFLSFIDATIPITDLGNNVYEFHVGSVEPGECGEFELFVEVSCDAELGQTHCTTAHIYPDSICIETINWSGASIELDADCDEDEVIFRIINTGDVATTAGLEYLVIEDEVVLFQGSLDPLAPAAEELLPIDANGSTIRLEVEQEPNHPGMSMPAVIVEGCGTNADGDFSTGMVNLFALDDANTFVDIDCQENVGAYDPNDKQAFPLGYGDDHFIEANTDIEYLIRFQNTGTDTAFNVVLKDTLSEFLDIETLRPGAHSHDYELSIEDERTLVFSFENILLPDSTTNWDASHGFVRYRISQREDLEVGTFITNQAAIYFDFNEPIFTNTTYHTIGEDFILVDVIDAKIPNVGLKVFPNPFKDVATFELYGLKSNQNLQMTIYDVAGKLVHTEQFYQNTFQFQRGNLEGGIYFFNISNDEGKVLTGKFIVY